MKTLKDHNQVKFEFYGLTANEWQKCGVLCDVCSEELRAQWGIILASHPPKQKVMCFNKDCKAFKKVEYMVI